MKSYLGKFGDMAQRLSRNPIGIIALFIVLVYGIAALVLGLSSQQLELNERLPLVWFLVVFPVLVLAAFYHLVAHHHVKLYAPQDFPDKEGFFRALSPTEQKQRLDAEILAFETEEADTLNDRTISADMDGTGLLGAISTRHAFVFAEELALREIESEFRVSIHRQVAVGRDHGVDGIFLQNGKPVLAEIKYSRLSGANLVIVIRREILRLKDIAQSSKPPPTLLLAVVFDGLSEEQREAGTHHIEEAARRSGLPIKIRTYDFAALKEKYGISTDVTQQSGRGDAENFAPQPRH